MTKQNNDGPKNKVSAESIKLIDKIKMAEVFDTLGLVLNDVMEPVFTTEVLDRDMVFHKHQVKDYPLRNQLTWSVLSCTALGLGQKDIDNPTYKAELQRFLKDKAKHKPGAADHLAEIMATRVTEFHKFQFKRSPDSYIDTIQGVVTEELEGIESRWPTNKKQLQKTFVEALDKRGDEFLQSHGIV